MSRLRASRLPVPAGTIPTGMPVPASSSHTARMVPSPPIARTRSQPLTAASCAIPWPVSSTVVSHQTTDANPESVASASTRVRNCGASSIFEGLRMTASFLRSVGYGVGERRVHQRDRARGGVVERQPGQHDPGAEQVAGDHVGEVVHPEEDPVRADEQRHGEGEPDHQAAYALLAHQHPGQHDRHAGSRGDPRGVARGERVGVEHLERLVPLRTVPGDEELERPGERSRGRHHPDRPQRCPSVLGRQRQSRDHRGDRHPEGGGEERQHPPEVVGGLVGAGELLRPATHVGIEREQRFPGDADEQRQEGEEHEAQGAPPQPGGAQFGFCHISFLGSRRITMLLETGVLDTLATESSATRTFVSGKYAAAQPRAVA